MDLNVAITIEPGERLISLISYLAGYRPEQGPVAKPAKSAKKPAEEKPAKPKKAPTMTAVKKAIGSAIESGGIDQAGVLKLLKKYEVEKVSDLPEDKLADFVVELGCE